VHGEDCVPFLIATHNRLRMSFSVLWVLYNSWRILWTTLFLYYNGEFPASPNCYCIPTANKIATTIPQTRMVRFCYLYYVWSSSLIDEININGYIATLLVGWMGWAPNYYIPDDMIMFVGIWNFSQQKKSRRKFYNWMSSSSSSSR